MGYYNMQEEKQDTEQTTDVNANLAGSLRAKLNRKFIGCELDEKYYDIAKNRITEQCNISQ